MENKIKRLNEEGISSRLVFLKSLEEISKSKNNVITYQVILNLYRKAKIRRVTAKTLIELGLITKLERNKYKVTAFCSTTSMAGLLLNLSRKEAKTKIKVNISKLEEKEKDIFCKKINQKTDATFEEKFTMSEKEFEQGIEPKSEFTELTVKEKTEELNACIDKLSHKVSIAQRILNFFKNLFN